MTYEADYPLQGMNPYGDKKANSQESDYKAWISHMRTIAIIRMPCI